MNVWWMVVAWLDRCTSRIGEWLCLESWLDGHCTNGWMGTGWVVAWIVDGCLDGKSSEKAEKEWPKDRKMEERERREASLAH